MKKGGIKWSMDTIPHLLTVIIGTVLMSLISHIAGLIYILVFIAGMLWFLATICTRCRGYDHPSCPSGYGLISSRLFSPKKGDFIRSFKRNIIAVALQWIIPLGGGIYLMATGPDIIEITILILFLMVAFVYLPVASRKKGCSRCPQVRECPWKR